MIRRVLLFPSGMVIVFDERGQQIPALQGAAEDVLEQLDQATRELAGVEYALARWSRYRFPVARDLFLEVLALGPLQLERAFRVVDQVVPTVTIPSC